LIQYISVSPISFVHLFIAASQVFIIGRCQLADETMDKWMFWSTV